MHFTHLINPFLGPEGSEHAIAQRVTFAALRAAAAGASKHGVGIEVLAAVFPEDAAAVEPPAVALPALQRSILDVFKFDPPRKFPIVADLLNAAAEHGKGEYLVFTNIDISPQPYFYHLVGRILRDMGNDPNGHALVINRRTISKKFTDPADLVRMYEEVGQKHPGFDCFVFPRRWVRDMVLGTVCTGAPGFDDALLANLVWLSRGRVRVLWHQRLTFHLGNDRGWLARKSIDERNRAEGAAVMRELRNRYGAQPNNYMLKFVEARANGRPRPHQGPIDRFVRKLVTAGEWRYRVIARLMAR